MLKNIYEVSPTRIRKKGETEFHTVPMRKLLRFPLRPKQKSQFTHIFIDELVSTGDKELDEAYTALVRLANSGNTSANKARLFMVGDFDALKKEEEPLDFSGATPGEDR